MTDTSSTSSSTSGVTLSGASFSALGIGSGLDLQSIITGLVTAESQPKVALQNKVTTHQNLITQYQSLNTKFSAIKTAAQSLNLGFYWLAKSATSSDSSVTATATNAAINGSLSFKVKNLATSEAAASYGFVSSTSSVVGTGTMLLGTAGSLGLGNLTGTGLSVGNHTVAVTQASAGAAVNGTSLGNSVTLNGTETLTANVDGVAKTFTLTAGTYNQQQLASMVTSVSNGALNVSVNSDKSLHVATAHEGSAASLSITGGSGLSALGLSTSGTVNGTNGVVTVDGQATTVTSVFPDGSNSVTLNGTSGSISATFSGGLRVGTSTVANIDLGDGKLSTVVNAINNANVGVTAAAVTVGANQYKLQLQSTTTGTAGQIAGTLNKFHSTLGDIGTVTEGQDATLEIGSGANAYTVSSSSNTIKDVIPGVTVNLTNADPSKTVTISVGGDSKGMSDKVKAVITAVNDVLSYIKQNSTYDASSKTAGALLGNFQSNTLQSQLSSVMTSMFGSSSLKALSNIGITSQSDGTYAFDETKFATAYNSDPEAVASLFVDGGTKGTTTGNAGFAEQLTAVAQRATDAVSGTLTVAIKGENTTIADLNKQIDDWTTRITNYQNQLILQFSAADTAVSNFKSQQTYLSGQISSLLGTSS